VVLQCANYGRKKQDQNAQKGGRGGAACAHVSSCWWFSGGFGGQKENGPEDFRLLPNALQSPSTLLTHMTQNQRRRIVGYFFVVPHTHTHAHLTIPYIQNDIYVKDIYIYTGTERSAFENFGARTRF